MLEKGEGRIPLKLMDKLDKGLTESPSTKKAIEIAELDGNQIDKNSKQGRLNALIGDELHGVSLNDKADLSLYGKIFNNPDEADRERRIERFKEELLYPNVLIDKNNLPDSYFVLQLRITQERGLNSNFSSRVTDIPLKVRQEAGEIIYSDQKKSLDVWVDYLASSDAQYPTWFKYYTLQSIFKMGTYDKSKREFSRRTKKTTAMFPDLNREALSYTYDTLSKYYLKGEKLEDEGLNSVLESANFAKIYAFSIEKATPSSKEKKKKTEGEWTKFYQGSDPTALCESLQGHGTGWCTAGEETARSQLKCGDFYVYYTRDEKGRNVIPRIAIRMKDNQVAEVRGINANQNLEVSMINIAREKYRSLPGGDMFEKKDYDMKSLTLICEKVAKKQDLNKDDLKFLYEIDERIEGFGSRKDPRIREIISGRNIKQDLLLITELSVDEIGITQEDALRGGIKYYYGDLDLSQLTSAEGLVLPKLVNGVLDLRNLRSVNGLTLPESVNGDLIIRYLKSAEGLVLPKLVRGNLSLGHLKSAEGLILPELVEGSIDLSRLISCDGLTLPRVGGSVKLCNLLSAKRLTFPKLVGGYINLRSLISAEDVVFPESVGYFLNLRDLTFADGVILPRLIGNNLDLSSLVSLKDLVLPESVNDGIILASLNDEEFLTLSTEYQNLMIRRS